MPLLFAATMFLSATLLFMVQPMVGKMTLPLLGGTPAVWNTCMVFFQALLLLGYIYAHQLTKREDFGKQSYTHLLVLMAAVAALVAGATLSARHTPLPIVKSLAPSGDEYPFFATILVLTVAVALPFFVLSTSAPLLQKWFSLTGHPSARDPYFLYGASNFGSLLSLLGYPFFIEPYLTVVQQTVVWAVGYVALAVMIGYCAASVKRAQAVMANRPAARKGKEVALEPQPTVARRLKWLGLAFVPSSLMLGVTTFISTDIASLPLLWVIPLALYLLTFIIAFGKPPKFFLTVMTLFAPVMILLLIFVMNSPTKPRSFALLVGLHIVTFFVVTLVCHSELARLRPSTTWLTDFYVIMSVGGMLGGLFNALVAPIAFTFITEYPLTLVLACFLMPKLDPNRSESLTIYDMIWPVGLFGATLMIKYVWFDTKILDEAASMIAKAANTPLSTVGAILVYGAPAMACYFFVEKPVRFGLCVAAIWGAFVLSDFRKERRIYEELKMTPPSHSRSFFGTLKVESDEWYNRLVHGTTLHGKQFRVHEAWVGACMCQAMMPANPFMSAAAVAALTPEMREPHLKPLTYYHPTGPVGFIMAALRDRVAKDPNANTDTACIGLGTGSLSAYGLKGQNVTFFEIDPVVRRLVDPEGKEEQPFNFVKKARERGVNIAYQMGDARLTLEKQDTKYALMFVDAFSSDAIPVHLLTKEAMELYFSRLREDGLLAVHISNRYLDLEPVVKKLAEEVVIDGKKGVECRVMHDGENAPGKTGSTWILLTRKLDQMGPVILESKDLAGEPVWGPLKMRKDKNGKEVEIDLWTDDFSAVLQILKPGTFSFLD